MPKYLNSNTVDVQLGQLRVGAGESLVTNEFFPVLPSGVTKTSDDPLYNSVIVSAVFSGASSVTIPSDAPASLSITIYASSASEIKLNSSGAVSFFLGAGQTWNRKVVARVINDIRIISGAGSVIVEKS